MRRQFSAKDLARRREILRKVQHIHRVTGHVKALQVRGVSSEVLEIRKGFRCPTCQENKRVSPRRQATLETLPRKWERIQMDLGDWTHPVHKHKIRFALIIDEGAGPVPDKCCQGLITRQFVGGPPGL